MGAPQTTVYPLVNGVNSVRWTGGMTGNIALSAKRWAMVDGELSHTYRFTAADLVVSGLRVRVSLWGAQARL